MTARHSTLFTLASGQSGLGIDTTQRDAAEFQEATQIVGFFERDAEMRTIKRQIKRSILDRPFG